LDVDVWRPVEKLQARRQLGIPAAAEVAIWHGRIELFYKGLDILIDAWEHVCRMRPTSDVRLFLIGMGPDSDALGCHIQKRNVRGIVRVNRWIGDTETLRQYLGCADLFVFSSRGEGFPVAPMEAMACGLPVVTSDANGMRDILTEGWASGGIIVPRNDPGALSEQIVQVLSNEVWRGELGKRARKRVETAFSVNRIGSQLAEFLVLKPAH
jgi:starch synthase